MAQVEPDEVGEDEKNEKAKSTFQKAKQYLSTAYTSAGQTATSVFHYIKWVVLVIGLFIAIAFFAKWNASRYQTITKQEKEQIKSLMGYAQKSAQEAQDNMDTDALQALLHSNYAVCYVNAAKHIVGEQALSKIIDMPVQDLEQHVQGLQRSILTKVEQQCT
jgi:hypothetical protein